MRWFAEKRWAITNALLVVALLTVLGVNVEWQQRQEVEQPAPSRSVSTPVIRIGHVSYAAGDLDFTYDGVDDNVQFQAALALLPVTGGRVIDVSAVQKNFSATVTRAIPNVVIEGAGYGSNFTNDGLTALFTAGGNGWQFHSLSTDAGGINMGATAGWYWERVNNGSGTVYDIRTPAGSLVNGAWVVSSLTDSGLTNGRIPIAGVGGLIGDDSDLAFSGSTLTATNLSAPTGRGATLFVAASDATDKEKKQADYLVTGTATDELIAAIAAGGVGAHIKLSTGNFTMAASGIGGGNASTIFLLDYQWLQGSGAYATSLNLGDNVTENVIGVLSKTGVRISDLGVFGNRLNNVESGPAADGTQNNIYANGVTNSRFENLVVRSAVFHAFHIYNSSNNTIDHNVITGNQYRAVIIQDGSSYNTVSYNYVSGNGGNAKNGGIGALTGANYNKILYNTIIGELAANAAGAIDFNTARGDAPPTNAYGNVAIGNTIDQTVNNDCAAIRLTGSVGGTMYDVQVKDNTIVTTGWAIVFDTLTLSDAIITGNTIRGGKVGDGSGGTAANVESALNISNNYIFRNETDAYAINFTNMANSKFAGNFVSGYGNTNGINLVNGDNNQILDNHWNNIKTNTVNLDSGSTGNRIEGNDYSGTTPTMVISNASNAVYRNDGYVTEASGNATLLVGWTAVNVTHGLSFTPSAGNVIVTPTNGMGNAAKFWVDSYNSSNFTINTDADPTTVNATFAWSVWRP